MVWSLAGVTETAMETPPPNLNNHRPRLAWPRLGTLEHSKQVCGTMVMVRPININDPRRGK